MQKDLKEMIPVQVEQMVTTMKALILMFRIIEEPVLITTNQDIILIMVRHTISDTVEFM